MEEWLRHTIGHLAAGGERTPSEMAQLIHEALEIAEVEKYATEESRFEFMLVLSSPFQGGMTNVELRERTRVRAGRRVP